MLITRPRGLGPRFGQKCLNLALDGGRRSALKTTQLHASFNDGA